MIERSDEALEALVRRHRQLGAQIAEIKGEQDDIKTQIDQNTVVGWKLSVDGVTAHKRPGNRVFDQVTAISLLDAETKESCVRTGYDAAALRRAADKAGILDACMIELATSNPVIKL